MKQVLETYRKEMQEELESILSYWMTYTIDEAHGGFVGRIGHDNRIYPEAPKGSVLNSRILWAFSAAYRLTGEQDYLRMAGRSFRYLTEFFIDKDFGGVYWLVDHRGRPADTKKQIYALSFAVYGLSEYYLASRNDVALQQAIRLYQAIVRHSYDPACGGYLEALSRDWKEISDLRLSAKDANEKKSMNTHLHVLEAFAQLFSAWPDEGLKQKIVELIRIFLDHIISPQSDHLLLFFDERWTARSQVISYGHDIEAAWLIQEAAGYTGDGRLLAEVKKRSVQLARAAAEGLDGDGGLWYEYEGETGHWIREKHSWPQAEAMVGFFNTWQNTGEGAYLEQSLKSWAFVKEHIRDRQGGEWYWGVEEDDAPMIREDKVGVWKCPYHNSRACMEIIKRINSLTE